MGTVPAHSEAPMTGTADCPFCHSRNIRASLPGTAQFLEYSCRDDGPDRDDNPA